jgi:tetratricopeptide (TPR) repeat protein
MRVLRLTSNSLHNIKSRLKALVIAVYLITLGLVSPSLIYGQVKDDRIEKEDLIKGLAALKKKKQSLADTIGLINQYGVDFRMTPDDENTIRQACSSPGKECDDLIQALRGAYKIRILVATFDSLDHASAGVTENIIEQLRAAMKDYPDVRVVPLKGVITAQDGSEAAQAKGVEHKADIVIWGWYRQAQVFVHFDIVNASVDLPLHGDVRALNLPNLSELQGFEIQTKISKEMTYLALLTVGIARLQVDDYDGAISRFSTALGLAAVPQDLIDPAVIYKYRGYAYMKKEGAKKDDFDHAMADLNQSIQLNSKMADAYIFLSFLHGPDNDQSIANINKAIAIDAKGTHAYYYRGMIYFFRDDYDRAIADFGQEIAEIGNAPVFLKIRAYLIRAVAYSQKLDLDRAIADVDQAITLSPVSKNYLSQFKLMIYSLTGEELNDKEEFDRALVAFNGSIEHLSHARVQGAPDQIKYLNFQKAEAYIGRGNALLGQGKLDLAIADFDRAAVLFPDDIGAYDRRAEAYLKKGNIDQALKDLSKTISVLNVQNVKEDSIRILKYSAYKRRGEVYFDKRDFDLAIADFTQAIALRGEPTMQLELVYYRRGKAYLEKNDLDRAIADLDQAIALEKEKLGLLFSFPGAYLHRGIAYKRKGNLKLAISDFNTVIESTAYANPLSSSDYYDKTMRERAIKELKELGEKPMPQ